MGAQGGGDVQGGQRGDVGVSSREGSSRASGGDAGGSSCYEDEDEEEEGEEEEVDWRWHEVQAVAVQDPVSGVDAVLLLQFDVTARVLTDRRMATLTETQVGWGVGDAGRCWSAGRWGRE